MLKKIACSVSFLALSALSFEASAGRLVSVKQCTQRGAFSQDCKTLKMPADRSCSAVATSLSAGAIGNSNFSGKYSIPAAGRSNKSFSSSIVEYGDNGWGHGVVRSSWGNDQIGEWTGSRLKTSGGYKINIKNFYFYDHSSQSQYVEYHCKM